MGISKTDLGVYKGLSIVRIDGFKPDGQLLEKIATSEGEQWVNAGDAGIDRPGSANWLCDEYGMQADGFDPGEPGILWSDYDCGGGPWTFAVLIDAEEVEDLRKLAEEAGYEVLGVAGIDGPCHFGDGSGTVAILKHPDGWCVVS